MANAEERLHAERMNANPSKAEMGKKLIVLLLMRKAF
jgi:hypothetical protein